MADRPDYGSEIKWYNIRIPRVYADSLKQQDLRQLILHFFRSIEREEYATADAILAARSAFQQKLEAEYPLFWNYRGVQERWNRVVTDTPVPDAGSDSASEEED